MDAAKGKLGSLTYARPAPCTGAEAAALLQSVLSKGSLSLSGSHGFYFIYELLTGSLDISLLPAAAQPSPLTAPLSRAPSLGAFSFLQRPTSDTPPSFLLGRTLLRLLPTGDSCSHGLPMAVLRALAANFAVARHLPRYEPPPDSARQRRVARGVVVVR